MVFEDDFVRYFVWYLYGIDKIEIEFLYIPFIYSQPFLYGCMVFYPLYTL